MIRKSAVISLMAILWMMVCLSSSAYAVLGSSTTQNGITITQNFSSVYYVDTKTSPYPTGFYAVYNITNNNSTALSDVWVTLGNFAGSTVYLSLGGNDTGAAHLGSLAAGATKAAYFFLNVDCSSFTSGNCNISSPQSATADVYLGPPTANLLASLTTNDMTVYDTIAASANKVNSGSVSTTTPSVGSTFTVTVSGSTGSIGGSNIFALSPQTSSSFPSNAFRLTKTSLTFSNGGTGTYTDMLQIPTSVMSAIASADYTVTYTYQVTGTTSTTTSVQPIAYINSGSQIKHTTVSSLGNIPPIQAASNTLLLSMSVTPTSFGLSGGTATYTVHITNSGTTDASLDEFIDALASSPAAENYINGSSTFAGAAISDPTISGSTLIWSGTFTVPAGGSADMTFQTGIPSTVGTYTDSFYGLVSASQIDTTLNTSDDAETTTSITVSSKQSTTISISNLPASGTYGGSFTPAFSYTGDGTKSVSSNSTGVCTVTSGVVHYVGTGTCSLTASATAGTNYNATTGTAQTFTVGQATPTISVSNLPSSGTYGGSFTPTFSYTGDGTSSVSSNSTSVCTVTSGVVHYVGTGTCSVTASATAGTNYAAVTGSAQTFSVGQATPTISISNLPASGTYGGSFTPIFSYTGDGSTSVSSNSTSVCTVSSGMVQYVGVGTCSLTSSATAGTNYGAVTGSAQTFSVGKATPTISISNVPASGSYGGSFTPTFSYTGDGITSVSSNSTSICTVTSGVVHYVGTGACSLTASAMAGTNYNAVTGSAQTFSVGQGTPTISISNLPASGTYGGSFTPTFSYTGDGTTSVSSNSTSVCTVTSGVVHYVGVGTCSLTASATAGTNYAAVTGTAQTFSVGQATPTISISNLPASGIYGHDFIPTFSYTGDGTTSVTSNTTSVCTLIGSTVRYVGVGICSLTASATAGTNYAAVTGTAQTFSVGQATPTISISNLPASGIYDHDFIPTFSYTGDGTTSVTSNTTSVCTLTGGTVRYVGVGICSLTASATAGTNYAAVTGSAQTFAVNQATATVTLSNLNLTYTGSTQTGTVTTSPSGLSVTTTYNGGATAPTAAGSYTMVATINDANYSGTVTGTLVIAPAAQSITFAALPAQVIYGSGVLSLSATGGASGNPVIFSVLSGPGSISGSQLTIAGVGPVVVEANQAGNSNYLAASQVTQSVTSVGAALNLSLTALNFLNQPVGTTSLAQTLIITNPNAFPVTITGIQANGDFHAASACTVIAPQANCSVNVTFTPTVAGSRAEALTITNAQSNVAQTVPMTGIGTAPGIQVSPAALGFGSEVVSTPSTGQTLTIRNTGTAPLVISNIATTGDFATTGKCATVPAGSNCSLTVNFTPTAIGSRTGTLTLTDNAGGQSQVVNLSGTGTEAGVSLTPGAQAFPATLVGSTSQPLTATLTNTGNAALTGISFGIAGDFAQTNNCPASLDAGASCTINVVYAPKIAGAESGVLTVSDSKGSQTISLTGTGLVPGATLSTADLLFGGRPVNTSSLAQTVIFTNTGTGPVTINSVTTTSNFADTTNCTGQIAAGASCSINVTFTPASTGLLKGTVAISDTAGSQMVTLQGEGTNAGVTMTPSFLLFGAQVVNTVSMAQTVTAKNTGTTPLTLNPIAVSNNFVESDQCPAVLPVGGSCLISVSFAPTATGSLYGSLQFSDASGQVSTVVALSGQGTLPGIAILPSTVFFGSLPVGTASQAQTVTVWNTGSTPLQITAINATGDFAETDTCTASAVPVGGYCILSVTMTPTTIGTRTGVIQIANNVDGIHLISVSGVGQQAGVTVFPTSLAFGSYPYVSTSQATGTALSVTLTNSGNVPLQIGGFNIQGDFTETDNCGATVPVGGFCTLTVRFVPTALGHRTGVLTITDNAGGGTQQVSLAGDGSPYGLTLTPPVMNFGVQTIGKHSTSQTATLTNNTGQALNNLVITPSGQFTETDNCGTSLANGASCTIDITVTPASTGAITGTVTFSSGTSIAVTGGSVMRPHAQAAQAIQANTASTSSSTVGVVAVSASAIPPGIDISVPQVSFSVTSVGTGTVQTVTIRNTGSALPLTHLAIGTTNATEFPFTTTCPATLAAQASCTITINFTPTGNGLRSGIMSITADGGISALLPESGNAAKGAPGITLTSSVNTSMLQDTVTLTSAVVSTTTQPTGSISFMDGSTLLGTAALSNGVASLTTSALATGSHSITAVYSGDANYVAATANVVTQSVIDFSLKAVGSGASQTVIPGNSATYQVAIAPTTGTSFPVAATLTVTGLPQGATAELATKPWTQLSATSWQVPATTTLDNVSLIFHVPGQTAAVAPEPAGHSNGLPPVAWAALLLPFAYRFRRARRKLIGHLAILFVVVGTLAAMAGLTGCGSGNGFFGQAAKNYTITVTVTAGPDSHSTDLQLNVQ
ncbi:choice-of-anchor D domain-containing protein [Terriglobus albidus]|uniref:choice-of-anchor D domain-containing protein n=1 Tax=Terriglobus albidus TaxID=1592106 RepID=UPI0021E0B8DE|nr:choice-of-anchor D domain-containing protein [Terriglobus albidus]